ncbi:MAG: acyltransferase [Chthoniobacterales bacterium]
MPTQPSSVERIRNIVGRYGWRTPIVSLALFYSRHLRFGQRVAIALLRCSTRGRKPGSVAFGRDVSVTVGGILELGEGCFIGDRSVFEIGINPEARIAIGDNTWISHDFHAHSLAEIRIGRDVLIGEFVSVRDTTHTYRDMDRPIKGQPDVSFPIEIGDGVWIGRGCLIQARNPSLQIGLGAIVGANSVVTKSVPPMEIWAGAPARLIARRSLESAVEGASPSN